MMSGFYLVLIGGGLVGLFFYALFSTGRRADDAMRRQSAREADLPEECWDQDRV